MLQSNVKQTAATIVENNKLIAYFARKLLINVSCNCCDLTVVAFYISQTRIKVILRFRISFDSEMKWVGMREPGVWLEIELDVALTQFLKPFSPNTEERFCKCILVDLPFGG